MSKTYIFSLGLYNAFQENMLDTAEISIFSVGRERNFYFYAYFLCFLAELNDFALR